MADKPPSHIAYDLLAKALPPETATAIFTDKVLHKPLHLRPTSPDPASQDARSRRRLQRLRRTEHIRRRQKVKPLSAKEKRISGIYDIPKEDQKYEIYEPLHRMWIMYMWEVLGIKEGQKSHLTAQSVGSKLVSADFHGAELEVVRSRCMGRVGTKGIVVKDTKFTFEMVTGRDVLITVPKGDSVFRFEIPQSSVKKDEAESKTTNEHSNREEVEVRPEVLNLVFELHGSQFENRAVDRATKKFKQRNMSYL